MRQKSTIYRLRWPGACALLIAGGCANLDARPDYDRAGHVVASVTGASDVYDPAGEATIEARTRALLDGDLSVHEAVQVALLNNPRFQAAAMSIGMARAELAQSGLLSNPTLGLGVLLPSGGGLVNLQVDLAQRISELWEITPRRRAAEADLESAILDVARQAATLAAETKSGYFDAVGAQEVAAVAVRNVENVRRVREAAAARREAGAGTELDVNLAEELMVESELADVNARLEAAESRRKLATLLGLTSSAEDLRLSDSLPIVAIASDDLAALMDRAREHRLDLKIAQTGVDAAAERCRLERRRALPDLEAGVSFERDERRAVDKPSWAAQAGRALTTDRLSGPRIEPAPDTSGEQTYILGPTLSIELPVFDQNQAQIARAEYEYLRAVKDYDAVERAMVQEVRGAADRASAAWQTVELYKARSLPLAERNVKLASESYELGKTSFLNVLESQRFFLQAQTRYLHALTAAAKTIPDLEITIGLPISELRLSESSPGSGE